MAINANTPSGETAQPRAGNRTTGSVLGHDADWWNVAVVISLIFAVVAACAVAGTTYAVIMAQKREAAAAALAMEAYKASVALKVEDARNEGLKAGKAAAGADLKAASATQNAAQANERAAEARKGAAEAEARAAAANERARALEKDAAQARLEQERLKVSLAWRVLSQQEASALQASLAAHPGSVNLWYTQGDPESLYLAIQFDAVFRNAHWTVLPSGATLAGIVFGIAAPDATGSDAAALRAALHSARIEFSTDPLPPWQTTIGATRNPVLPTLMIGSRRPAVFR